MVIVPWQIISKLDHFWLFHMDLGLTCFSKAEQQQTKTYQHDMSPIKWCLFAKSAEPWGTTRVVKQRPTETVHQIVSWNYLEYLYFWKTLLGIYVMIMKFIISVNNWQSKIQQHQLALQTQIVVFFFTTKIIKKTINKVKLQLVQASARRQQLDRDLAHIRRECERAQSHRHLERWRIGGELLSFPAFFF